MSVPALLKHSLPAMRDASIERVRAFERENLVRPQTPIATHHLFHAGMYHRTILLPAGVALTGALIKRATTLVLNGHAIVYTGVADSVRLDGYHVLPASAKRKQAFYASEDTHLTMLFATTAKTVREAEEEFTDEADLLFSRSGENHVNITGE